MFSHLQIPYRGERWLVGAADLALRAVSAIGGLDRRGSAQAAPRRILLLRLERIGDLLMVLDAIALVRRRAPDAQIDLAVGSWNEPLARLIPGISTIEVVDAPWMTRHGRGLRWRELVAHARRWRARRYDLAINFEPDIRSNLLMALSRAARRVGFVSGGGGAVLTDRLEPDPAAHISANATALVARAFPGAGAAPAAAGRLNIPEDARRKAAALLASLGTHGPVIGIQPAAGRRIKEWDPVRFAEVGAELSRTRGAQIVLIGSVHDAAALEAVAAAWPADVPLTKLPVDTDLVVLGGVLERLALLITGDTGPMHLAAAVGTPVLAIFGPSLPTRYAPLSAESRLVRIDIHCSPCNLMRRPPARCVGHVPDCLAGIGSDVVLKTAYEMLSGFRQASTVDP